MRHQTIALTCAGLALALGGCAHNDVLVFGTDTKVAIDVETAATQGGSPSITIGYKRKEAVWMPLLVNAKDSKVVPCVKDSQGACTAGSSGAWSVDDAKYKSTDTTSQNGKTETRSDAYSVFASLGAKFDTGADASGAKASGGLAQFFATGVAAINISQNEALVTALKVDSPQGSQAQAVAVAAAAGLTAAQTTAINDAVSGVHAQERPVQQQAADCWAGVTDPARRAAILTAASAGSAEFNDRVTGDLTKLTAAADVLAYIAAHPGVATPLAAACKSATS